MPPSAPLRAAVAKLAAHRPKDTAFVADLIESRLLETERIRERAALLPSDVDERVKDRIASWLTKADSS